MQSKIFASQGFVKLASRYGDHCNEKIHYLDLFIGRILDLGGKLRNGSHEESQLFWQPLDWIKHDLRVSKDGLSWLCDFIQEARDDVVTCGMLSEYYRDEETDMFWSQEQIELVEKIGLQKWLVCQM